MAQVYSVNMVGYINASVPTGFSMLANQLNATPDNKVVNLLPAPPNNTAVFKFDPISGGYISISFLGGAWEGDDLDMTLNPGEGVFISANTAFTATFVGEVQLISSVPIKHGFQILSSALPQSLALDGAPPAGLGFPIANGDETYQFDRVSGGYIANSFLGGAWEGDGGGAAPVPGISEAFWVNRTTAPDSNWTRTFTVGP